jgi:ParB-like chromosome segregation protein Spo0J
MEVTETEIHKVFPYARNPRRNESAIAKVAASIQEFGWRQPIVVDSEMIVIAGHTRLEAARLLGLNTVPVHIATGLTDAQIKASRLAEQTLLGIEC